MSSTAGWIPGVDLWVGAGQSCVYPLHRDFRGPHTVIERESHAASEPRPGPFDP
jgi:hypothetical protein